MSRPSSSIENYELLFEKIIKEFNELYLKGLSLRVIAKKLNITYYQSQQLFMKRKMRNMTTIITHCRTIYAQNQCFSLRLIPYCLLDGSLDTIENPIEHVKTLLEQNISLPMCCEIQVQPDVWLNFDYDAIHGNLEDQINTFYKDIKLSDFAIALSINFSSHCIPENYKLFQAALKQSALEEPIKTLDNITHLSSLEIAKELINFTSLNHPNLNLEPYQEIIKQWEEANTPT